MTRTPEVFTVIPVHNRHHHTMACLECLGAQNYPAVTVVLVDDGSTDDTVRLVQARHPKVVVLKGDGNLWWTGATNLGIEWALHRCRSDDYILTLNNDTTVGPDYIATLARLAESAAPALVGSVAVDSRDGETIVDGGPKIRWSTAKWWSINQGRRLPDCLAEGMRFVEPSCLPGRGTLIPVTCLREVGLFNAKRLPHYAADYEFSLRAARSGYRLLMSYESPVVSDVAATGVSVKRNAIPWRRLPQLFFSRRSPSCLMYRWRFARLSCARWWVPAYVLVDTARVVGGTLRDQLHCGPSV